jgi:chorismate-pyruvate lyase
VARWLGTQEDTQLYSRTYLIHHQGRPLGEITEKFAADTLR